MTMIVDISKNMTSSIILFINLLIFCYFLQGSDAITYSCYYQQYTKGTCKDCNVSVIPCYDEDLFAHCFASYEFINGNYELLTRGCFPTTLENCEQNKCHFASNKLYPIYYCCCLGNLCNTLNLVNRSTLVDDLTTTSTTKRDAITTVTTPQELNLLVTSVIVLVTSVYIIFFMVSILFIMFYIGWSKFRSSRKAKLIYQSHFLNKDHPEEDREPLSEIELLESIGCGRFAQVFRGKHNGEFVAVKVFQAGTNQEVDNWQKEKQLYSLPCLKDNPNILKFYFAEIRAPNVYWVVTEYHPQGSLCYYLKQNSLNLEQMMQFCTSLVKGLAFLHSTTDSNGHPKPAIAHRDLKSKNVLITSKMTLVIADLGMAVKFEPGVANDLQDIQGQVGTIRYMAPELLDGAISFNKEAFQQIDMYACGLIFWEIVSRFSLNGICSQYKQPYQDLISYNPSPREMKEVVVEKGLRPPVREDIKQDLHFGILANTIVECWDAEPLSRLSAACIRERLTSLTHNLIRLNMLIPSSTTANTIATSRENSPTAYQSTIFNDYTDATTHSLDSFRCSSENNIDSHSSSTSLRSVDNSSARPLHTRQINTASMFVAPSTGQYIIGAPDNVHRPNSLPAISDQSSDSIIY